ncbi:MAG: mucoidy inhibitor MuiA family protein [Bacteroidales bacterium]|jgi:uncharacterized protein (TIGR02231 family)|nr:mucoidy inhibitor MuiA family protein [Bacteroidales bacterium]
MKLKTLFFLIFGVYFAAYSQKPIFTTAKVQSAAVYFSGAELTQVVSLTLPVGVSEVVVRNVADNLDENTIRVAAPSSVTVLSAHFTSSYLSEYETIDETSEIKKVKDSIEIIKSDIQKLENQITTDKKSLEFLDKNNQTYTSQQGFNTAEIEKMLTFYRTKRLELQNNIDNLTNQKNKKQLILNTLNTKISLNSQDNKKISKGTLLLQLMSSTAAKVNLDIHYIAPNANWVPCYDFKVENISQPAVLVYKAQIYQQTGIDWKSVKLSLSSGNPSVSNRIPVLKTWLINFGRPITVYSNNTASNVMVSSAKSATMETRAAETAQPSMSKQSGVADYTEVVQNQLNVSYDISVPYDIASNNKAHAVTLKEAKIPVSYQYYSVPKLDKSVYLTAEIANYSQYNILNGEANIILEGIYNGKTQLTAEQTTDTLSVSMGKDPAIVIKREKITDKSDVKFLASNKEQTFTYDISVRNNKSDSISLILKDQYPISGDSEIEVTLLEKTAAEENKDLGILTWKLNIPANKTQKVRLSYKVKYPKSKTIINL